VCHSALETICDRLLPSSAFNFNLRRDNLGRLHTLLSISGPHLGKAVQVDPMQISLERAYGFSS